MSAGDSDNDSDNDTGPLRAAFTSSAPLLQYGFVVGFLLGGYTAGQRGALQFLAEHQHELPRTRAQGLAFHRNKNYRMMAAFVSGGMRRGTQLALVAATYSATRIALEHGLQRRPSSLLSPHVVDTVCGALVGSVLFALSSKPASE